MPTWTGFLFLAIALDAFSRRVVGWAMATHSTTGLVLDALEMALAQRSPDGVIHHSELKCELLNRRCFKTAVEARHAIFRFIEGWYIPHRRHSSLGNISPVSYEKLISTAA